MWMVPTIKPPPPVEDSHASDSSWTLTKTESDSVPSPCPVHGIWPTLHVPKVILYSKPPPVKLLPWMVPLLAVENFDAASTPTPPLEDIILRRMVPMVKPPPSVEGSNAPNAKALSLDDTVHVLRDLLFTITLPKMGKAKMAAITVEALAVHVSLLDPHVLYCRNTTSACVWMTLADKLTISKPSWSLLAQPGRLSRCLMLQPSPWAPRAPLHQPPLSLSLQDDTMSCSHRNHAIIQSSLT